MDAYASVGMPVNYRHWSYGKEFIATEKNYRRGHMGLAYEIVINSNPCISYLMEENTMAMQALVIAHAAYGHNSFFKGNYLFRMWTDASSIIDYLVYAKNYVAECEESYGIDAVEDAARQLPRAAEPRRRPLPPAAARSRWRRSWRAARTARPTRSTQVNDIWRTLPQAAPSKRRAKPPRRKRFPSEPQENLLYFIEKNAPLLEPWQREVVRIVRKIAQYFYPQRQTQVMNEGWATFWHHQLLNTHVRRRLADRRRDDRVAEVAHQRGLPAAGRPPRPTAASTRTRSASRCTPTSSASARTRPTRTASGSPTSPARRLAADARPRDAQLQGRELHRPVPVARS